MKKSSPGPPYNGKGWYELRDSARRLFAKGDYKFCIVKLQQSQNHTAERALSEGWTIQPLKVVV